MIPVGLECSDGFESRKQYCFLKWVDVNHECGGFIIIVNGKSNKLQYYPIIICRRSEIKYSQSALCPGCFRKSNASEIVTIEYDYKVPVCDVTFI